MDKYFIEYAPLIIVILAFIMKNKLFITPEQLECKHREILKEIDDRYVRNDLHKELKEYIQKVDEKVEKVEEKVDAIYELLIKAKG